MVDATMMFFLLIFLSDCLSRSQGSQGSSSASGFYPRKLPEYCSRDMSEKKITALSVGDRAVVAKLVQVQAVLRHGARIPWKSHKCWRNYNIEWNNCNVFELSMPQLSGTAAIENNGNDNNNNVIFRKVFDASPNQYRGNCLTGQLLEEGYMQEKALGDILRNAYIHCEEGASSCFPLFSTNKWSSVHDQVYFRADDAARVMMSGQLVMSTLFDFSSPAAASQTETCNSSSSSGSINKDCGISSSGGARNSGNIVIDIHTGEFALDRIYPNYKSCPRLLDIESEAFKSDEFLKAKSSERIRIMEAQLSSILGGSEGVEWSWNDYLDCVMTTFCTNRSMPGGGADIPMTDDLFDDSFAHSVWRRTFLETFNSSIFSKVSMGLLIGEIRSRIQNAIVKYGSSDHVAASEESFHPLYLYAAHDSTLMPILAALLGDKWDAKWASYASMIVFELYQVNIESVSERGEFAFRLVYDGVPLEVPGCDGHYLCDVRKFFELTQFSDEYKSCL